MLHDEGLSGKSARNGKPDNLLASSPSANGDGKAHRNGKPSPDGRPQPDDRLTPEESARKFDIKDAIDAIPVQALRSSLKPLCRRMMDHADYGQGLCYASYATLGSETGTNPQYPRKQIPELVELGFFVPRGRRGTTGRSRPQFAVGPRLIRYLRDYLAWKDGKQVARRNGAKVERFEANLRPAKPPKTCVPPCDTRVVPPCDTRVVPPCDTRVVPLGDNNPSSSAGPKSRSDEPPGRPDVRVETAPSVPVGEKSGGKGPPPLSPSTSTDGESLAAHDPLYLRRTIVEGWVRDALSTFAGDFEQARIKLICQHGGDPIYRQLIEEEIAKRKEA